MILRKMVIWTMCTALVLSSVSFASAETAGKTPENFADLVLFVQFNDSSDVNFMQTADTTGAQTTYSQKAAKYFLNTSEYNKSLPNYLKTVSYDQFNLSVCMPQYDKDTQTVTPLTVSSGYKDNESGLIKEIAKQVNASADIKNAVGAFDFDMNKDGYIDNLTIITNEGNNSRGSTLYPHKANYDDTDKIFGKTIYTYNIYDGDTAFGSGSIEKEGVIIHEFMHSMGFPDLYAYDDDDGKTEPVGGWDIMSQASTFVQWPLAYMRSNVKGWLSISEITKSQEGLSLVPASERQGNEAYILKSPLSDSEFFVVEYRQKSSDIYGLDYKIPGSGLIVYRIDQSVEGLSNAKSGSTGRPGVLILGQTKDAANTVERFATTFFPNELGGTSFGSTDLSYEGAGLTFSDGSNSGIALTNIGSAGNTISFDVTFADISEAETWKSLSGTGKPDSAATEIGFAQGSSAKYFMYTDEENNIYVYSYQDGKYSRLGSGAAASVANEASILCYNEKPYVIYKDNTSGALKISCFQNGNWQSAVTLQSGFSNRYGAIAADDGIYMLVAAGENKESVYRLVKYDGTSQTKIKDQVASGLYEPSLVKNGDVAYASFRDASNNKIIVKKIENGALSDISSAEMSGTTAKLAFAGGTLYAAVGSSDGMCIWKYSNGAWNKPSEKLTGKETVAYDLQVYGSTVFLAAADQSIDKTFVWYEDSDGTWVRKGNALELTDASAVALGIDKDSVYAAYLKKNGDSGYPEIKSIARAANGTGETTPTTTATETTTTTTKPTTTTEPTKSATETTTATTTPTTTTTETTTAETTTAAETTKPAVQIGRVTLLKFGKSRKSVTVKWRKVSDVTYYQIYRAYGKTGQFKAVKTVSAKTLKWTNKKLKRNKIYSYKIRALKKINGIIYYGPFSSVRTVKTKR